MNNIIVLEPFLLLLFRLPEEWIEALLFLKEWTHFKRPLQNVAESIINKLTKNFIFSFDAGRSAAGLSCYAQLRNKTQGIFAPLFAVGIS